MRQGLIRSALSTLLDALGQNLLSTVPRCGVTLTHPWIVSEAIETQLTLNTVFPPDCAIAGISRCIQRRPPEKRRKGQFSPLLLQGCMQA